MKKTFLLKTMLLLCALVVGSNVWAQAPTNTILWAEDFSGFSNNANPSGSITNSHTGTTVYGDVTLTYSKTNGGTTTQTYTSGGPNSNANLLISKSNGTFSVSGISTGGASELTVSYAKSGNGTIEISSSTSGVSISGSVSGSTITTNGASTLQLTFKNTSSGDNLRIDDIELKVKTPGNAESSIPTVEITPNYTFFGQSAQFSGNANDEVTGSKDGVTITYTRNNSSLYANNSAIRFYKDNVLRIDAPTGRVVTSVVLDHSNNQTDVTSTPTGYDNQTYTWTGSAASVSLTRPSDASSYLTITKITVNLGTTASITANGDGWATWKAPCNVSFRAGTTTAYIVTAIENDNTQVNLVPVTSVPGGTPVLLSGATGTHTMDVVANSETNLEGHLLHVMQTGDNPTGDIFVLAKPENSEVGFYKWGGTAAALVGKVYLQLPSSDDPARTFIALPGEETGINNVSRETTTNNRYFDLQGRPVAQPTKGLYIVNGKKVIIK